MAVGCGPKCAKVLLILFNFIFWLSGAALLGVGIWLKVDKTILKLLEFINIDQTDPMLDYAAYLIIALGAFVFLVGFCGCCGAIKENKCLLGLYIFFLFIIMAGEIAAGVLAILYKDKVNSELTSKLTNVLQNKYVANNTIAEPIDFAQIYFKCCGVNGPNDWDNSTYSKNTTGRTVPESCCRRKASAESKDPTDLTPSDFQTCANPADAATYDTGCYKAAMEWFDKHATILIGVGIGIACLELFGFIFAICLCRNTGDED